MARQRIATLLSLVFLLVLSGAISAALADSHAAGVADSHSAEAHSHQEHTEVRFERQLAPKNARAYIISPVDGETVSETFTVQFGLSGMGVAPAGVKQVNTGHHHLLINVETLPALDMPLPATDEIVHFGLGQTETEITLPPGKHTLQILLGDYKHVPHEPPVFSEKISVVVK